MRLLLISNSTNAGEQYLEHCIDNISDFLKDSVSEVLFIPYAAVTFSYDDYEQKVAEKFDKINVRVKSIHKFETVDKAFESVEAIVVGGGNTFALLKRMVENDVLRRIKQKVNSGVPYIGWSAGSNVACPTISTTNDMPIVEPENFNALNFVNFQINPHYLDAHPEGHAGETRQMRIEEFVELNRDKYVVGLREGTMLLIEKEKINLIGKRKARIFKYGQNPFEVDDKDDLSFLLK